MQPFVESNTPSLVAGLTLCYVGHPLLTERNELGRSMADSHRVARAHWIRKGAPAFGKDTGAFPRFDQLRGAAVGGWRL